MKRADAPPPGWYPDPVGGTRLRWWDGLDWTDHRRPPPPAGLTGAEDLAVPRRSPEAEGAGPDLTSRARSAARGRDETAEIMAEVRKAAREEVDRAANTLAGRARDATRGLEPLISQYGDRVLRWLRNAGIVLVALVVLWMLLQTFAQTTLLDWVGDRVDNLFGGWGVARFDRLGATGG